MVLSLHTPAATRYVSLTGSHQLPYTNWTTAATTIQAAVSASLAGDFIWVTDGVYRVGAYQTPSGSLSNRVVITNAIVVQAVNGPGATSIEGAGPLGNGAIRCVYMSAGRLDGFTLTNGHTRGFGGALNAAGGGLYAVGGALSNCQVVGCQAADGGGAYGGTWVDCTFRANTATNVGGAILAGTVTASSISGNWASVGGGAATATLIRCAVVGNTAAAGTGGGAQACTLRSCAVWGNAAAGDGGGLNSCQARNCTIVDNRSGAWGGGARGGSLTNCIVYFNRAPVAPDAYSGTAARRCCIAPPGGWAEDDCLGADPKLLSFVHLASDSPCVGAGVAVDGAERDIDAEVWNVPPSLGCDEPWAGSATGPLQVSIRLETTQAVSGAGVQLVGETFGRPTSNVWHFGDGQVIRNSAFVTPAWPTAGTYEVSYTAYNVSNPTGVTAFATVQILSAESTARYVATNSPSPTPPFDSWSTAARTIQEAVDAQPLFGGWVWVTNGEYLAGGGITPGALASNRVVLTNNIVLKSVNGPEVTIIRGSPSGAVSGIRCVFISAGRLEGFTLTGGFAMNSGSLYYDLNMCGGGVNARGGIVSNCVIRGNQAYSGDGGGANFGTYYNCVFSGNVAAISGAVDWGTLYRCIVVSNQVRNSSFQRGGGVGGGWADGCLLLGNSSPWQGGGAYIARLRNCVLSGNYPDATVGGRLLNCTVVSNQFGTVNPESAKNCIIYYNTDGNTTGGTYSTCCTVPVPGGAGHVSQQPRFLAATVSNYPLQFFSACMNAGTGELDLPLITDFAGQPRVVGAAVDLGAFESSADVDGDGLSDAWERHYAGGLTNLFRGGDWDGDGFVDEDELVAGEDPCGSNSLLQTWAEPATNGGSVLIQWPSVEGRVYSLWAATNVTRNFVTLLRSPIAATPPLNVYTDINPNAAFRTYGVRVKVQP